MPVANVYLIGTTIFAESLSHMLEESGEIRIVGVAASLSKAVEDQRLSHADVILITEPSQDPNERILSFLESQKDIPVIYTDLQRESIQVITSVSYRARVKDLKDAILSLPKRR